jgi:hypothetical protein
VPRRLPLHDGRRRGGVRDRGRPLRRPARRRFLPLYQFNLRSGTWAHTDGAPPPAEFSLNAALAAASGAPRPLPAEERRTRYAAFLAEAEDLAARLAHEPPAAGTLDEQLEPFRYFAVAAGMVTEGSADDAFCGGF